MDFELLQELIARIGKENSTLNALVSLRTKEALEEVVRASKRPLKGMPIVVEDSLQVKGAVTTFGSTLLRDNIAEVDDLEITRLKEAGCVVVGKSNLSEFGFSPYTKNRLMPPTVNPLTQEVVLGCSGGAAVAVAAGWVPVAIGSDIAGGVRLPAYDCKLYGLKPTRGRIPIHRPHVIATTEKLFHQKGILARDPRDIASLLKLLGRPDSKDLDCCCIEPVDYSALMEGSELPSLKIGYTCAMSDYSVDKCNLESFEQKCELLRQQGHQLIELPCHFGRGAIEHYRNLLACDRYFPLLSLKERDPHFLEKLDPSTVAWFHHASRVSGIEYAAALLSVQCLREEVEEIFEGVDLLLTPCLPEGPVDPLLGEWAFTLPFNLSGHPALVLPSGVQVVGKYFDESLLLRFSMDEKKRG